MSNEIPSRASGINFLGNNGKISHYCHGLPMHCALTDLSAKLQNQEVNCLPENSISRADLHFVRPKAYII